MNTKGRYHHRNGTKRRRRKLQHRENWKRKHVMVIPFAAQGIDAKAVVILK